MILTYFDGKAWSVKTCQNVAMNYAWHGWHAGVVFTSYAIELQLVIVGFHSNARTCQPANTVTDLSFIGMDHYLIKGPPQSIPVLVSIVTSHDEMIQM